MANKYSNHLFELIKSLSKAEKRYFKVFVNRHTASGSTNNAQILFDAIDKMTDYDESILIEQFKNSAFVNKFSITKARLYDTILKSLGAFYSEKSKDQLIRNEIHSIEILFNKSLYKQCYKKLISAKKQAVKYSKNLLLAELIDWEKKLIEKDNYQLASVKEIQELTNEVNEVLKTKTLNADLWELKAILFQKLNKIGRARTQEQVNELKLNVDSKIKSISIPDSEIELNYLFNHIQAAYYFGINDVNSSLNSVIKTINIIEVNPNKFSDEPNVLTSTLTNGVYLALKNKDTDQAQLLFTKLKKLYQTNQDSRSKDLSLKIKSSLWSIELLLVKLTCDFKQFDVLFENLKTLLEENPKKINSSRLAFLYYNIAHILFIKDEFSEALKWTNKLLNSININQSQEIYSFAEILNLFIHLELGNIELVNYSLKSTKRFLKTRDKIFDYEKAILKFLQKVTSYNFDKYEMDTELEKLVQSLKIVLKNPLENIPIEYFDCLLWAESKLKNKNLSDLMKNANQKLLHFKF